MTDPEDRDCGTCKHYDSMEGFCKFYQVEGACYEDACENWEDWEDD